MLHYRVNLDFQPTVIVYPLVRFHHLFISNVISGFSSQTSSPRQLLAWIVKNVPNDFPIKTNKRANVEMGGAKPRRHWERVENEIGLESGKKAEFDTNLANWLEEVGLHSPPTCQTVISFAVPAGQNILVNSTVIIKCRNHVHMQEKVLKRRHSLKHDSTVIQAARRQR